MMECRAIDSLSSINCASSAPRNWKRRIESLVKLMLMFSRVCITQNPLAWKARRRITTTRNRTHISRRKHLQMEMRKVIFKTHFLTLPARRKNEMFAQIEPLITISFQAALNSVPTAGSPTYLPTGEGREGFNGCEKLISARNL